MSKIILPGLIDIHVHLRDPGQTEKEDFQTGTSAALAGGYTTIIDMPNNKVPITTQKSLNEKIRTAKRKILCDTGFYFGSLGDNINEFPKITSKVMGLKLYLSQTTGGFIIPKGEIRNVFKKWPKGKIILLHAEDNTLDFVIELSGKLGNKIHICHISSRDDLRKIIKAKENGLRITCGVTPHHLFLTERDVRNLGSYAKMKPPLRSNKDQNFLWKNLKYIDLIESDHAPHTIKEKNSNNPPFGVPNLETTLPLLITAMNDKRLDLNEVIRLCFEGPKRVLNLKTNPKTTIEVDIDRLYTLESKSLLTKCRWSPFLGMKVKGKVKRVFIRGKKVFEDGKVLVSPGFGKVLTVK